MYGTPILVGATLPTAATVLLLGGGSSAVLAVAVGVLVLMCLLMIALIGRSMTVRRGER